MQTQQPWNEVVEPQQRRMSRTEPTLDIDELLSDSLPEPAMPPLELGTESGAGEDTQPEQESFAFDADADADADAEAEAEAQAKSIELQLREKLASAEANAVELQQALNAAKADVEIFRRRAHEDVTRASKFAIEGFAECLVPVKDSLESALKIDVPTVDSIKEGVKLTLKQLSTAFEKNQLTEICPMQGDKLDPMKHQAVSMEQVDQNPNTIINVLQKGYMIADRLLRPALVTVAQRKADVVIE